MILKKKPILLTFLLLIVFAVVTMNLFDIIMDASNRPTYIWEPTVCVLAVCGILSAWAIAIEWLAKKYLQAGKVATK